MQYSKLLVTAALAIAMLHSTANSARADGPVTLTGAGATFPYPIYSKWAYNYQEATGTKINYQSIGSGGGIAQVKAKTVDFGASDAPLTEDELTQAGLIQFPLIIGGIVPVVHVEGLESGKLRLTPTILADIFMGKIESWDDASIKAANPDLTLPAKSISIVHRADGSGTTWIFTNYLAQVSTTWKEKVGAGKAVSWPVGMGGKGNEGVAAYVKRIDGAIGYVEYAYALQNNMPVARLQNREGKFVEPTLKTFQAAAANADWKNAPGYYMVLVDQPGDESWPITGASFILIHKEQADTAHAQSLLKFFDWCYKNGAAAAEELQYVAIPSSVADLVKATWKDQVRAGDQPVSF
jgi:phosphate transport system substrate-binding protein